LDQPRLPGPSLRPSVDADFFGSLSERVARFLGTGQYLAYQSLFIIAWLGFNIFAPKNLRFDPYTFTFLTLLLSLQAAYAAPLILLAQNRQDDRDRVNLAQDRDQNSRLLADTEYLTREVASLRVSLGDVVTRDYLRAELRTFLEELDEDADERSERSRGDKRPDKQRADKQRADKQKTEKQRADKQRADRVHADTTRAERSRGEKDRGQRSRGDKRPQETGHPAAAGTEPSTRDRERVGRDDPEGVPPPR
jgi:uncharacterized membrane protein